MSKLDIRVLKMKDPCVKIWWFKIPFYVHPMAVGHWPYFVACDIRIHQQIGELPEELVCEVNRRGLKATARITVPDESLWEAVEPMISEIVRKNAHEGQSIPGVMTIYPTRAA